MGTIVIYTDGATPQNGRGSSVGGAGVYFGDGDPRNAAFRVEAERVTNNQCELIAILKALEIVRDGTDDGGPEAAAARNDDVEIRTDSMLCLNTLTTWRHTWAKNGWVTSAGTPVKNVGLVREVAALLDTPRFRGRVSIVHVKGHAGHHGNEMADAFATQAARTR